MKSCTSIDDLLLVALRMTFGGAPNPSQWSDVSEMITDLANDLVRRDDWDPSVYHSPHQHLLDTEGAVDNDKGSVDKMSVFGKADYFAVNYPPYDDLPRSTATWTTFWGLQPRDAEKSAAAIRWRSTWSGGLATPRPGRRTDQTPTGRPDSVEGFPSEGVARYLDQQAGLPVADAHSEGGRMPTRHRRLLPQERPGVAISATRAPAGASDLNTLEFLAAFVGMIVEFHEGAADGRRRSAQSGDSTSAAGWLAKSNFNDDCPLHLTIARAFADFCLTHEIDHYTQLDHEKLLTVCSTELQDHPLRPALISQIEAGCSCCPNAALADSTRAKRDSSWRCYERFLGRIDGVGRSLFSKDSDEKRKQKRSPASPPPFGTDGFAPDNLRKLAMDPCPVPFVPPSTVWLRPSGLTNLRAQSTTPPDDSTPSGFTTETLRRRGPRTYPTAGAAVRGDSKGSILGKKETDIAIGQLVVVAFFFAMRSCEYSDVGSRRTTSVIRVDDVRFRQKGQDLQTTDRGQLENADTVTITFRRQKNGDKGATVTQHRNDRQGQTDICPVRASGPDDEGTELRLPFTDEPED
ncbi:hypothetical protein MHU86_23703 [Fragilaria crotonensis]|nr:hypothetical protein MHU86_23703 [Fragilaria crotonensis]